MKRIVATLSVLILILVGCGNTSVSDSEAPEVEQIEGDQIVYQAGWDPNASNDSDFANFIREYTGANYVAQVGPLENYSDKLMLDLASEVPMNLVKVADEDFGQILSNGLALDLRPYLEKYGPNIMDKVSDEAWASVTDDSGAVYAFPALQSQANISSVMMYRKDILEKEGYKVPTTTDEVVSTVCGLAEKGYKTPWAINWGSAQFEYVLRQSFGVGYWWNATDDGSIEYFGEDSRYLDYLNMAKSIYDCGGFGNDYETISQDERNARFVQGDSVFLTAPYWEANAQAEGLAAEKLKWEDVVGVQSVVTGPNGHKSAQLDGGASYDYTFIPSYMAPYAKQTIEFVNKLYEDDFITEGFYGTEGETFEYTKDGIPFSIPGTGDKKPHGDGGWYKIGGFNAISNESAKAELSYLQKQLDDGKEIDASSRAELLSNDGGMKVGVTDPMGPAITLNEWSSQQECANNKTLEFGDLYITGKKTEDDFAALGKDLENSCNFTAVNEEVKAWYESYYKNKK